MTNNVLTYQLEFKKPAADVTANAFTAAEIGFLSAVCNYLQELLCGPGTAKFCFDIVMESQLENRTISMSVYYEIETKATYISNRGEPILVNHIEGVDPREVAAKLIRQTREQLNHPPGLGTAGYKLREYLDQKLSRAVAA